MTGTVAVLVVGLLGGGSGLGFLFGWTVGTIRGPRLDRKPDRWRDKFRRRSSRTR